MSWSELQLEDCMEAIIDYRGKTPRKTANGVPLITAKVVKRGRIEPPNEFIAPAAYEDWMRRGIPRAGDVVITTEAPMGEVAQLGAAKIALAQRIILLRGKDAILDNSFLKYLLQSAQVQQQLRARASGTTVLGIRQSELRRVVLSVPSVEEQRAIAGVLGAFDDKIELNRRMNETLEAMARALFKSWFVNFDPIRAKAEGRQPIGMDAETAKLFPSELAHAGERAVPSGWEIAELGDVIELKRGYDLPASQRRLGTVPIISSSGASGYHDTAMARAGGIVTGRYGTIGKVFFISEPFWPLNTTLYVHDFKGTNPLFAFQLLAGLDFFKFSDKAAVPGVNRNDLHTERVIVPPSELQQRFGEIATVWRAKGRLNDVEAATLANLRDALLPRLLSGELRLRDAEPIASVAT